ncbi:hypothetical protein D9619_005470 [Psilocybe cf. subviscida]|uniref:Zn(2)-C6 fungal-type domain-containing protein n=1 Tax=Psilocybe cf. subviscida TaxID=2480587 RepID=A0A8H5BWY8_9AGAR|nr:hypothetical protein D9619_005470 [Psilocybe cf. subviscida]
MGFQNGFSYSSFMNHALGDKCQTSLPSDIDASSEGDLSLCGERGDSPAPLSIQGSLDSDSHGEGGSNGPPSPTLEAHKNIRQRTAQACDKCRERKTKCSGNRPVCNRCSSRGLICEYSVRESRVRTPIRVRPQPPTMSPPNPLQVNYHDTIRPTPAYHSRVGHGQSQAFAPAPYPRTVSSHSPAPSSSYSSGISLERAARLDASGGQPIPLGLGFGLPPDGQLTATRPHGGVSTWDMRPDTSRPQSAPITPQYASDPRVPSRGFKIEANVPQVQDLREGSCGSYGHDLAGRGALMTIPSIRVEEDSPYRRSLLGCSTEMREGSSQWYRNVENASLAVPKSAHDGRPASMPTMPLVQRNAQHHPKPYECPYDISLFQPNPVPFEDWTGPSSMGSIETLPEATSILAAHYNSLGSMSSDNMSFGTHGRTTAVPGPQDVNPLEVLCPAPLLPIGSGIFGLSSSLPAYTGKPTAYSAHDASQPQQQQQNPNFDAMYMHFAHEPTSRDVGGMHTHHDDNTQQPHPHAAGRQPPHPADVAFMPIAGHDNDFTGYDFF